MNIFKKQVEIIINNNLKFINPNEFADNFDSPKSEKKVLLTIDDAFLSFYEVAWPYLKKIKSHLYYLYLLNLLESLDI